MAKITNKNICKKMGLTERQLRGLQRQGCMLPNNKLRQWIRVDVLPSNLRFGKYYTSKQIKLGHYLLVAIAMNPGQLGKAFEDDQLDWFR